MTGVSPDHTSVPRWGTAPPEVDTSGAAYLVMGTGAVPDAWCAEIARLACPVQRSVIDLGWLAVGLAESVVGVRLMAAGTELEILDVIGTARAAGLLDAEMRLYVSDTTRRRVHCTHCQTATEADVAVGDTIICGGCARTLLVYHHVSRAHGAYMGFMADAEEPDA